MKKTITVIMLILLTVACKEKTKPSIANTYLTATINGEEFSSTVDVVSFRANKQTLLTTADNPDATEYSFTLIIKNDRDNDPNKKRYGFVEIEDETGNMTTWKLPNNFNFSSTDIDSDGYTEGNFSFIANAFANGVEDNKNQLIVTNGKFKAKKPGFKSK